MTTPILGTDDKDFLFGTNGADIIDGGKEADTMTGYGGNDTYYVDNANDKVVEAAGEGTDTVISAVSHFLEANVEKLILTGTAATGIGNDLDNTLTGNDQNNLLSGGLGKDTMTGGKGDDIYYVDNAGDKVVETLSQAQGGGFDAIFSTVNFSIASNLNLEQISLNGSQNINATGNSGDNWLMGNAGDNVLTGGAGNDTMSGAGGNDTLDGQDGDDTLKGGIGDDTLTGGADDDILDGGAGNDDLAGGDGADAMSGGAGNDVYDVSDAGDTVIETVNAGIDLVRTNLDGLVLAANVENLELLGSDDLSATGNALANVITGNDGQNTLAGGAGNDTYFVESGDTVLEAVGGGKDTVQASGDFALAAGSEIETLLLQNGADGAGNEFANTIIVGAGTVGSTLIGNGGNDVLTGSEGEDRLEGGEGDDVLTGGLGNDELLGFAGKDVMAGGKGDDQYEVSDLGDKLTENANEGFDAVFSTLADFTLGANFEQLTVLAVGGKGTGNALDNFIQSADGDNVLNGAGGNDIIDAGEGNDTIQGGAGDDILHGGFGADTLLGEAGADLFIYIIQDDVSEIDLIGGDTITGFQTGIDKINLGDLLVEFDIDEADAFAQGHVLLTQSNGDTLVKFDADGAGGTAPVTLATVKLSVVAVGDIDFADPNKGAV